MKNDIMKFSEALQQFRTDPGGLAVDLRPLACWDYGFESRRGMDVCLL
jgi:hypothetical protein